MKKTLQIITVAGLLCCAVPLHAVERGDVFTQGALEYTVNYIADERYPVDRVYVSGRTEEYPEEVIIPSEVEYDGITFVVSGIGDVFKDCISLTSVTIPNTVTWIENSFENCTGLTKVDIPESVTMLSATFSGCTGLKEITLPTTLTWIANYTFYNCSSLTSITIPEAVTSIGDNAFSGCSGLTEITIPSAVTGIGSSAFAGCFGLTEITIPNTVETIGKNAFNQCKGLTAFIIEDGETALELAENIFGSSNNVPSWASENITKIQNLYMGRNIIGTSPFQKMTTLSHVTIGENVTTIGEKAFSGCYALREITLPNSITSIGDYAFYDCRLSEITIPNSVISIGDYAFAENYFTNKITLGDSVATIGAYAFCHADPEIWSEEDDLNEDEDEETEVDLSRYLTELVIPNSVTSIGKNAFWGYSKLATLTLGASVSSIGEDAFGECGSLTDLIIADGDTELTFPKNIFTSYYDSPIRTLYMGRNLAGSYPWDSNLNTVIIGDQVTELSDNIFQGCKNLTEINLSGSITTIGQYAFEGCSGITSVTIPASVTKIGTHAFYRCNALDEVITPSLEAWLDIEFGNQYANPLQNASKFIADGTTVRRMTLPEGTERINAYAFFNYESLVSVNFPAGVKSVGNEAFSGANGLQRFTFNNVSDYLGLNYDSASALLPTGNSGKIYINQDPYVQESVMEWPAELKEIPAYAFWNNTEIHEIIVPDDLRSIGTNAFSNTFLWRITTVSKKDESETASFLPKGITYIPYGCFSATLLTEITIPASVKELEERCFSECERLKSITFEGVPEYVGLDVFTYYVPTITIADVNEWTGIRLTQVPFFYNRGAIYTNDTKIENLVLEPESDYVSAGAFSGSSISKARIKAAEIEQYALYNSTLESLCIETETIGKCAFNTCQNLKEVYSLTSIPPTAPDDAFSTYDGITLYVPVGSRSAYENTETCWCQFLDIIESNFSDIDELFKANYVDINTGIAPIATTNSNEPAKVYNLNGYYLGNSTENLPGGIYIVRQGSTVKKIKVD